jgi:hypothetical protein
MTLIATEKSVYNMRAVALTSNKWKYDEGDRVRPRDKPEDPDWIVLRRLSGCVFPHYELMDDDGKLWHMSQLTLITA